MTITPLRSLIARALIVLALAFAAATAANVALVPDAHAGSYPVHACYLGTDNRVWAPVDQGGGRLSIHSGCGDDRGLVTRNAVAAGATADYNDKVWWQFDARAGTVISRLDGAHYSVGGGRVRSWPARRVGRCAFHCRPRTGQRRPARRMASCCALEAGSGRRVRVPSR